nr:chorismate mutase precursor protein [Globodera rostochiensis]ABR19888.1 chorismate mutase precursor protein [Globodera rostochiensis]ABR19889.1 chorismate mutase precursor protein [Globodera rostochiensis]
MNLLVVPFFLSLFLPFAPAAKSPARRAVANRQNGHINCEKHCTDHYLTENNKCKSSEEVILRKSDCAFMKSIEDGFKFVVGMEGQTETESTTGNNIFMCCKPNQETATLFIVGMANKRLMLAKDVVLYKYINNNSIDDFEREKVVLQNVLAQAKSAGISDNYGEPFFQDQMDANKVIQKGYVKMWNIGGPSPSQTVPDLQTITRPKVTEATADMVLALKTFQTFRNKSNCWRLLEHKQTMTGNFLSLNEPNGVDAFRKAVVRLCGQEPKQNTVHDIDEQAKKLLNE